MKDEDIRILQDAGIDAKVAIMRFMGDEEMFLVFLHKFLQNENLKRLYTCVEMQDSKGAFACAHALKGVALNLGAVSIANILTPLVEELRNGQLEETGAMIKLLKKNCAVLEKTLEVIS